MKKEEKEERDLFTTELWSSLLDKLDETAKMRDNIKRSVIELMKELTPLGRKIVMHSFCIDCGGEQGHEQSCEEILQNNGRPIVPDISEEKAAELLKEIEKL